MKFTKKQIEEISHALADARIDARRENKLGHTFVAEFQIAKMLFGSVDHPADKFFRRIAYLEDRRLGRVTLVG